jgi:hypothetical protein
MLRGARTLCDWVGKQSGSGKASASAHSSNPASRERLISHRYDSQTQEMPVNPAVSLSFFETSTPGRR